MTEEKNTQSTQWHPAFTAAMHMEFVENKDDLDFQSEVTLTFVREHPPVKLFKKLKEINLVVEEVTPGIYYVSGHNELMIQLVVSKELDENCYFLDQRQTLADWR